MKKHTLRMPFKASYLIIVFLLMSGAVLAQSENARNSDVEILKLKWEKQLRLPRNFDPSDVPTGQVFNTMETRTAAPGSTQAPYGDDARREAATRSDALSPVNYFPNAPSRMPVVYEYSMTIRNAGVKTIQAVAWDYVFVQPVSRAILGNHHLFTYTVAKTGKNVTLKGWQRNRPISVVSATNNETNQKNPKPLERAVIQCVLYEDQTTWQNPVARADVCDSLKKNKPALALKTNDKRSKEK